MISPKPPPQKKMMTFHFFCRQPSCLGCLVWITFCCLPHGRCGSEGLPISLQCDEPFYRMDFAHGRQSNLATVYRSVPFRPWSRNGDHHLPGLYSRNLPSVLEGCVREFPSGESIQQFEFSLDVVRCEVYTRECWLFCIPKEQIELVTRNQRNLHYVRRL